MATRILVPLDGSETAERVLPYATGLARQMGSTLHVVRVVSGSGTVPPEVGVGQAAPFGGPVGSEADTTGGTTPSQATTRRGTTCRT